jgi:hypothetical protein
MKLWGGTGTSAITEIPILNSINHGNRMILWTMVARKNNRNYSNLSNAF